MIRTTWACTTCHAGWESDRGPAVGIVSNTGTADAESAQMTCPHCGRAASMRGRYEVVELTADIGKRLDDEIGAT